MIRATGALLLGVLAVLPASAQSDAPAPAPTDIIAVAAFGSPADVRQVLRAGADVESRGEHQTTALMRAASANPDPEVVTVLLENGAKGE
jgi:hypothetical protein